MKQRKNLDTFHEFQRMTKVKNELTLWCTQNHGVYACISYERVVKWMNGSDMKCLQFRYVSEVP